jgi:3-oxoadipate enol-lactonase
MPEVENEGARIWYTVDGRDDAPAMLLMHSLGTTNALWDEQLPLLVDKYRLIRYDARGHGKSTGTPGDFTIELLGRDALAVLDAVNAKAAVVCGISIGGLTAIWLGQHQHDRVQRLVLANTAARIGSREGWSERIDAVRESGMEVAAEQAMPRWFTDSFRVLHPDVVARFRSIARACPLETYLSACAALRDTDLRRDLHRITAPTLVVAGTRDQSTTVADGAYLRDNIPEARMEVLEAAHLSNVERPTEFSAHLADFLSVRG